MSDPEFVVVDLGSYSVKGVMVRGQDYELPSLELRGSPVATIPSMYKRRLKSTHKHRKLIKIDT